jgi:hypothetical protein
MEVGGENVHRPHFLCTCHCATYFLWIAQFVSYVYKYMYTQQPYKTEPQLSEKKLKLREIPQLA